MSKLRLHTVLFSVVALVVLNSCKKDFDELNQNPNAITSEVIQPDYLFPKSVIAPFSAYNVGVNTELWALMTWTQMVGNSNAVTLNEEYIYGGSDVDLIWSVYYTQGLTNVQQVINLTQDNAQDVNKTAIARIWKVYLFHVITDLWGDIPYSEALKGDLESKILYPKYDSQQSIYEHMLSELKAATTSFDPSKKTLSTDMIYGGDLDAWTKLANTLRLRLALRIYNADQQLATEHIQELMTASNFINSASEGAYFEYSYGDNVRSPIAEGYRQAQVSELPSQLLVNLLLDDQDPRISYMIQPTEESQVIGIFAPYVGTSNFSPTKQDGFYRSNFNERFIGGTNFESPEARPILSYEESCMLQAEAALKGFGGDAASLLSAGIRAHMYTLAMPDSVIDPYVDSIALLTVDQELISTEKWKCFFMRDGFEAYAEWRRTGFPKVLDQGGSELDQTLVPTRLPLPSAEISRNENIKDLTISPTDMFAKVWWDQ